MTLPDLTLLKLYLRKEDSTAEDTLLTALLANATGLVRRYVERPLTLEVRTFVDVGTTERAYGRIDSLLVPVWPVHPGDVMADPPIAAPVITDGDDVVVDAASYALVSHSGTFRLRGGDTFPNGPYTIVASVGLAARHDYATVVEPVLSQAILDVASDLYSNRTPSAQTETAGGGASVNWRSTPDGLPSRVCASLLAFKPVGVV